MSCETNLGVLFYADSTQSSVSNEEPQVPMCVFCIVLQFLYTVCPIDFNICCRVCPKVLWSQRKSHVLLAVQLRACRSHDVIVSPHSVKFRYRVRADIIFQTTVFVVIEGLSCEIYSL